MFMMMIMRGAVRLANGPGLEQHRSDRRSVKSLSAVRKWRVRPRVSQVADHELKVFRSATCLVLKIVTMMMLSDA